MNAQIARVARFSTASKSQGCLASCSACWKKANHAFAHRLDLYGKYDSASTLLTKIGSTCLKSSSWLQESAELLCFLCLTGPAQPFDAQENPFNSFCSSTLPNVCAEHFRQNFAEGTQEIELQISFRQHLQVSLVCHEVHKQMHCFPTNFYVCIAFSCPWLVKQSIYAIYLAICSGENILTNWFMSVPC